MNERHQVDLIRATEELLNSIKYNETQQGNEKNTMEKTNQVIINIPDFLKNRK